MSPKRLLRFIRLRRAMAALSNTDMEIKQIAAAIGLTRGDGLARLLRSSLNVTPGDFRRRTRLTRMRGRFDSEATPEEYPMIGCTALSTNCGNNGKNCVNARLDHA